MATRKGGRKGRGSITVTGGRELAANLRYMFQRVNWRSKEVLKRTAKELLVLAKTYCPTGPTGTLKESIKIVGDNLDLTVIADAPYASAVEFGSRPSRLPPKGGELDAKVQAEGKNAFLVAKSIQAHGTKPYPFMTPAADEVRPSFLCNIAKGVTHALREVRSRVGLAAKGAARFK